MTVSAGGDTKRRRRGHLQAAVRRQEMADLRQFCPAGAGCMGKPAQASEFMGSSPGTETAKYSARVAFFREIVILIVINA